MLLHGNRLPVDHMVVEFRVAVMKADLIGAGLWDRVKFEGGHAHVHVAPLTPFTVRAVFRDHRDPVPFA